MLNVWTLILAAGKSERFGSNKALAPWREGTLLSNALMLAQEITAEKVCTVVGRYKDELLPHLTLACENKNWSEGMGSSIARGVSDILERDLGTQRILILPVDQPLIHAAHLRMLLAAATDKSVLTQSTPSLRGPPAVLHRRDFSAALRLHGPAGLKSILKDVVTVTDYLALEDVDTPEDLDRLSRKILKENSDGSETQAERP